MSKCHIGWNHISRLNYAFYHFRTGLQKWPDYNVECTFCTLIGCTFSIRHLNGASEKTVAMISQSFNNLEIKHQPNPVIPYSFRNPLWSSLPSHICTYQRFTLENHCTRTAQSSHGGCSPWGHRPVHLAVNKGNILVIFVLLKYSSRIIITNKSSYVSA